MPKEKYIYPKNHLLKMRLDTLIKNKGFNKPKFYKKMEVSPQLWYFYSWGIWKMPTYMRIKVARLLETDTSLIFDEDYGQNEKEKQFASSMVGEEE